MNRGGRCFCSYLPVRFPPCLGQQPSEVASSMSDGVPRAVAGVVDGCGHGWVDAAPHASLKVASAKFPSARWFHGLQIPFIFFSSLPLHTRHCLFFPGL